MFRLTRSIVGVFGLQAARTNFTPLLLSRSLASKADNWALLSSSDDEDAPVSTKGTRKPAAAKKEEEMVTKEQMDSVLARSVDEFGFSETITEWPNI
jgi:hypothetical protein